MQLTCVRAFGTAKPGDVVTVPDGAYDKTYWQEAATQTPAAAVPAAAAGQHGVSELQHELADAEATIAKLKESH